MKKIGIHIAVLFIIMATALFIALIGPLSWPSATVFGYALVFYLLYLGGAGILGTFRKKRRAK